MSLLIYSPRCKHSMDVIEYINKHQQLKQLVNYHNVNTQGIPAKEVSHGSIGAFGCSMTSLDGDAPNSDLFSLNDYGQSLQPAMTKELEEKIGREVSKGVAYEDLNK